LIPDRYRAQLEQVAENIIKRVCRERLGAMRRAPVLEIDFVASLIENGAGFLEAEWQRILVRHGIAVRVAGIFCHQSPMVSIKETPSRSVPTLRCELADLLVLHSHSRSDGKVFWRGVLLQAKSHSGRIIAPDEPQLWLYEDWPRFAITSPGFDGRQRDFGGDERSGLYALVSNKGWRVLPANNPLVADSMGSLDLSKFLVNILYDMDPAQPSRLSTHGRQVYQNSKMDWSPTIWELIEVTARRALSHKGAKQGLYAHDVSRVGGGVLQMMWNVAMQYSAAPPDYADVKRPEGGEEGVSILIIETGSAE
jgi:hypothetical protein